MLSLLLPVLFAITADTLCVICGQSYFYSNFIVFGTFIGLMLLFCRVPVPSSKPYLLFTAFSIVATTIVEVWLLSTDTWGFSRQINVLSPFTLFGAPAEEYIFWNFCPIAVVQLYLFYVAKLPKTKDTRVGNAISEILGVLAAAMLVKAETKTDANPEGKGGIIIDDVAKGDASGRETYKRGANGANFTIFLALVVASIVLLRKFIDHKLLVVLATSVAFMLLMMPYEQYAVITHTWVYNLNKMFGTAFLGVPVEEWILYILCPLSGCLMLMFAEEKFDVPRQ